MLTLNEHPSHGSILGAMPLFPVQVFAGRVQTLPDSGRPSAIAKHRLTEPVHVGLGGLAADSQADLSVHGGPDKAVHVYASDHLGALSAAFPDAKRPWVPGVLGENLSVSGLSEQDICIGDVWTWGEVQLQVCQPRMPCWKIDEHMGAQGVAAYIDKQMVTGWYCRVLQAGVASEHDAMALSKRINAAGHLDKALRLCAEHRPDLDALERLAQCEGIAPSWATKILKRVAYLRRN